MTSHLTPTPEQEAVVLRLLSFYASGLTARDFRYPLWGERGCADGRTVRAWLRSMAAEGKVKRVSEKPERWGLA